MTYQGRVVDLIYRDYAVEDLLELEGEGSTSGPCSRRSPPTGSCPRSPPNSTRRAAGRCSAIRCSPGATSAARSAPSSAGTCRGRASCAPAPPLPDGSKGDLAAYVRHAREELILKPNRAYGGTGVTVGPATDAAEWARCRRPHPAARRWVAQRLDRLQCASSPCWTPTGGSTPSPSTSCSASRPARSLATRARLPGPGRQRRPARRHVRARAGPPAGTDRASRAADASGTPGREADPAPGRGAVAVVAWLAATLGLLLQLTRSRDPAQEGHDHDQLARLRRCRGDRFQGGRRRFPSRRRVTIAGSR